jgi:hypothetical protein
MVPTGAAPFAATGTFVDGGPSAGFGGFHSNTFHFVACFDVCNLPFLFVRVTGFVALRDGCS